MIETSRDWYRAIFIRHSRRKYSSTPIDKEKLDSLSELIDELNRNTSGARVALVRAHDGSIFSGIRGGYGIIKGAPAYLAFIAESQTPGSYERLGYIGEAAVLEATALGLGTCWVSGTFDPRAAAGSLELTAQESLVAVSPIGHPQDSYTLTEKVMSGFAGSRKRKPLEEICAGEPLDSWPDWALKAAEAGRIAPSAMNRQPWVFRYEGRKLIVETVGSDNGKYSKQLDCGIALRHLETGALHEAGGEVSLEFSSGPYIAHISVSP